ncbi:hypothetical protein MFLAVUS_006246 [Mucor flavus]|uniref:Endonuclease n=1 Tax=Mucor flavus TaxID=439312 RepID=A0ABP9Z106_9FUNG
MGLPTLQISWLTGGFFLGMFFMYNLIPVRNHVQTRHLHSRAEENSILKFGNPGPVVDLFERTAYTASYNRKDRIPHWVGEHLTEQGIIKGEGVSRDKSTFKDDKDLPALFRAYTKDYTLSGYDRGHMAPAADASATQEGLDQTFLLSNIAPQVGAGFNRQYWAYLEAFCRDMTKNYTDVFVYSGPLFLPQLVTSNGLANATIEFTKEGVIKTTKSNQSKYRIEYNVIGDTSPNVAVPTHFFKVLLLVKDNQYTMGAFVLPNQVIANQTPLSQFQVDLQAVEKASGLLFFEKLDRKTFLNLCDMVSCIVK